MPNSSASASRPQGQRGQVATRQYLYINQLAELTPWSPQRIRGMIHEGEFVEGVHFFRPKGARTHPVFSWEAVVQYIEGLIGQKPKETFDETARAVHALLD